MSDGLAAGIRPEEPGLLMHLALIRNRLVFGIWRNNLRGSLEALK